MQFSTFLASNIAVFRFLGVWPNDNNQITYGIYSSIVGVSLVLLLMTQYLYLCVNFGNIEEMTAASFVVITFTINLIKAHILCFNGRNLKNLLNEHIFKPTNQKQIAIIFNQRRFYKIIYYSCIFLGTITGLFWGLKPLLATERELPMKTWFPFNALQGNIYILVYIFQVVMVNWNCQFDLNFDVFTAGLMMIIGVQIDGLCDKLENLDTSQDSFKECFRHYANIIRCKKQIQKLYKFAAIGQFLGANLIFCSTFLQLTVVSIYSLDFVTLVFYCSSILMEVFLFCWFGNEIIHKSDQIMRSIFYAPWLKCDVSLRRNFLIFMIVAEKPIVLVVGGILPMSVQVFTMILRTSYSYFTVIGRYKMN